MKLNLKSILIPLSAVVLIQSGCRNPDDVSKDLQSSISNESLNFDEMKAVQDSAGDQVVDRYSAWVISLGQLATYSKELSEMWTSTSPDKRKDYEGKINNLRSQLDVVLQRNETVKLMAPSWHMAAVHELQVKGSEATASIQGSYLKIYGQTPVTPRLVIQIERDDRLLDTYGDCVGLFASERDSNCQVAASKGCTHQTDIDCIKRAIASQNAYTGLNCSEKFPGGDIGEKSTTYDYVPATWLKTAFASCASAKPIFK